MVEKIKAIFIYGGSDLSLPCNDDSIFGSLLPKSYFPETMAKILRAAQLCIGASLATGLTIEDDWAKLNASIGGRLEHNSPLALPCFPSYNGAPNARLDEASCSLIRDNYTSPTFRAPIAGSAMNTQDEICLSYPQDQCILDNNVSPAAMPSANASCHQGNLPTYRITVRDAKDVQAAFAFAREHPNISISVKNSGHDYMMRNLQRDSLLLWVHELQNMSYHETFVPQGCSTAAAGKVKVYGPVLTVGTGVSSDDATAFATAHNSTLLVGSTPTVAVSGGWVLGAGHSVLSPVYGLGIDRVVQVSFSFSLLASVILYTSYGFWVLGR